MKRWLGIVQWLVFRERERTRRFMPAKKTCADKVFPCSWRTLIVSLFRIFAAKVSRQVKGSTVPSIHKRNVFFPPTGCTFRFHRFSSTLNFPPSTRPILIKHYYSPNTSNIVRSIKSKQPNQPLFSSSLKKLKRINEKQFD